MKYIVKSKTIILIISYIFPDLRKDMQSWPTKLLAVFHLQQGEVDKITGGELLVPKVEVDKRFLKQYANQINVTNKSSSLIIPNYTKINYKQKKKNNKKKQ
jgi:hypothetical protein